MSLGYNVDRCIRLRIPPCPLHVDTGFQARLGDLLVRRQSDRGIKKYEDHFRVGMLYYVEDGQRILLQTFESPVHFSSTIWRVDRTLCLNYDV